ncbi:hypothetical protein E4U53_002242 [Claviceps sorghi]|nr:hypothetical protein E4U53_002242 [Claviceps sorghi]
MSLQRTFTLIPPVATTRGDPLDRRLPTRHVRPMTSKQAQKAYKAATRAPPVSRAEQRRRDREEQERIRREFEKEKATAKARLAREKRKEKESAEREQKRRKGMPLVSVRPSQDTIARFVRGNGSHRKRDCAGATVEETGRDGDARELDLVPEEQLEEGEEDVESGLEELLDAVSRGACGPRHPGPEEEDAAETDAPPPRVPLPGGEDAVVVASPTCLPRASPGEDASEPAPPPMSTQAILGNLDDFFPSSSQQARELQDDAPWPPETPAPNPSRRFFTPSGSSELVSLAVQRSRRAAALHQSRPHAQPLQGAVLVNSPRPKPPYRPKSSPRVASPPASASPESEYGGEWIDDLALELIP